MDSLADFYHHTLGFNGTILVYEKGKTLLNKGYGYQDRQKNIPNNKESIYLIGSVTKQFTSHIILMLASEGRLSVQDKLSKYYPGYKYGDSITLAQMLSHTSGIFDYTRDSAWEATIERPITDAELFAVFWDKPLLFSPGTSWDYSNTNYKLLGNIIEKVTGKTYYQNIRERIFIPLGMTHSGFDFAHLRSPHKTTGYYRVRNDSFLVSVIVDSTQTNAAGSIYSTTGDMLKWHQALQTHQLLASSWQDQAFVPVRENYGYGWDIDTMYQKLVLHHSGHIHGYNSNFYHLPGEDVCIVVFTNLMKTAADPVKIARNMVRALYDSAYEIPPVCKEIRLANDIKKRYEGSYMLEEDSTLRFDFTLQGSQLMLNIPGQAELRMLPASPTLFFTRQVDARIEFVRKENGGYDMILHQYGQKMPVHKL